MSMVKDFRDFVGKGNAIDLAVGVIIGSAISTILKSFVDELVVPLTGLISKVDFSNMYVALAEAPETWTPERTKFKRPSDWLITAWRGIGRAADPQRAQFLRWMAQFGAGRFHAEPYGFCRAILSRQSCAVTALKSRST